MIFKYDEFIALMNAANLQMSVVTKSAEMARFVKDESTALEFDLELDNLNEAKKKLTELYYKKSKVA